jgi:hypothetical protein
MNAGNFGIMIRDQIGELELERERRKEGEKQNAMENKDFVT